VSTLGRLQAHRRLAFFAVLVALQVVAVVAFIAREEVFLRTGDEILVESRPVDPRDPLRGDFIILAYDFERLDRSVAGSPWCCPLGENAYIWLRPEGDYWIPFQVTRDRPGRDDRGDEVVVLEGRVERQDSERLVIAYTNINQIFVSQGDGNPPAPPDVRLVVSGDGSARVVGLLIDGEPWPER
jgi:uncharacterized membrane-anchored protein